MKKINLLEILVVVFMICSISGCSLGKNEYDIVGMEDYDINEVYGMDDFPFQYPKNAKKAINLYNEMMSDSDAEFYYLYEHKDEYKQNVEDEGYLFYGELKDGRPDGMGILMSNIFYGDEEHARIRNIEYIGNFEAGKKNGYGLSFSCAEYYGTEHRLTYEGEHKKGGFTEGTEYCIRKETEIYPVEYQEFSNETIKKITLCNHLITCKYSSKEGCFYNYIDEYVKEYDGEIKELLPHGKGTEYYNSGEIKYKGEYKEGKYHGEGTEYYESGKVKYEGEYKNGVYHGKGTLYNEDGSVKYEGKFKKGNVA